MDLCFEGKMANYTYDPRDIPAYSAKVASRYLGIPTATIRSWVYGRYYQTKRGQQQFCPLIKLSNPRIKQLSFTNLIEAHILRALRVVHGISMDKVRLSLDYLEQELNYQHPLVRAEFRTDGVDLFVEHLGKLVPASQPQLSSLNEALMVHLERIEVDEFSLANRLFPFGFQSPDTSLSFELQIPKSVVIDPRISFGRTVLVGTGIPTAVLAERYKFGESIFELASDYRCEPSLIEQGIRWELPVAV